MRKLDAITGPAYYYNDGKANVGPLDYAEQQELSIAQHAVIKYVTRAGRKPGNTALKDYKQARFYLDRLIEQEEAEETAIDIDPEVFKEQTQAMPIQHVCPECGHHNSDKYYGTIHEHKAIYFDCIEKPQICSCRNDFHKVK